MRPQTFLLALLVSSICEGKRPNVITIHKFANCESEERKPIYLENVTLRTEKSRRTYINGFMISRMDLSGGLYLQEFKVLQCKSKESPDSCIDFKTVTIPDVCPMYEVSGQIWSSFFANTMPRYRCPVKKVAYAIKNAFLDGESIPFPVDIGNYWKMKIRALDVKTRGSIFCMELECRIAPMKNN